jgi:alpha-galactosidase
MEGDSMPDVYSAPDSVLFDRNPPVPSQGHRFELRDKCVYITAPKGVSWVTVRWHGRAKEGVRVLGDAFERGYGYFEWRGIVPERVMPWYCAVSSGEDCEGYGVKVRPNALCYWMVDQTGVTLTLDLRSGAAGAYIKEELCAAELVHYHSNEKPFAFLKSFCLKMADRPVLPPKPVYGSNSWYYCYGPSTPDLFVKDALLLKELSGGLENRPWAVLDCGWSETVTPDNVVSGTALAGPKTSFGDMKALADTVKSHGVHPGIWLRPLCVSNGKKFSEELKLHPGLVPDICLDPSRPETLEIVGADVRQAVSEWGYELIKPDFLMYDCFGRFHPYGNINCSSGSWHFGNRNKTSAQIIKDLFKTIADNAGRALILGCNAAGHLASGYFHINRIGDDTSGQDYERTRRFGVNTLAFRLCQHKAFFDVDADVAGQTETMDWSMNKKWLELLSYSGTPLFVSFHPEKITVEQKKTLEESFRRAAFQTDTVEVLDFLDTSCPSRFLVNGRETRYDWVEAKGITEFFPQ